MITHGYLHLCFCAVLGLFAAPVGGVRGAELVLPLVRNVEAQPLEAQVKRLMDALEYLGAPLGAGERTRLEAAFGAADASDRIQEVLDGYALFLVEISPEMRVKVAAGPAQPQLDENGWRVFLAKVHNEAGTTAELRAASPNGRKVPDSPLEDVANRWLDLALYNGQPLRKELSGLSLEYRIIQLYSRDSGRREAKFSFNVGQGTQDLGFRNEVDLLFECRPAREIILRVADEKKEPTTAAFVFRDKLGRVHPSLSKRLAPDFAFHPQVYRADGERLRLPDGEYQIEFSRGPESVPQIRKVEVKEGLTELSFLVERWIDPAKLGWWSGDHHIHAAGCAHYNRPSEGVHAPDMMRHCVGEDLKVGANLTWGPCFDYQKQFFTGKIDDVSRYPYLLRYDVEVSGFGSHQSGHLCLLRLRDQIYPGGDSKNHWPTLGLNTLRWAKKQGAVCGPAHSGWGLEVETQELPNYIVPPYSGIGANEYIVDVTHRVPGPEGRMVPAVDFMSAVDTPYVWELNMWYHTLNVGFRTRISGETDFPCIYGERVGLGRSYVQLDGPLNYDAWCEGIRRGRNYVSDGKSHLMDFAVDTAVMGRRRSELRLSSGQSVKARVKAAAYLSKEPNLELQKRPYTQKPYWDVERARVGDSREVPVELIVNGLPVARKVIAADGRLHELEFETKIERSSWMAVRILPSSHSNPVFVLVGDKPIRASRRSAEWCLKGVDRCWSQKDRFIRADEKEEAKSAYDHARETYKKLLAECEVE